MISGCLFKTEADNHLQMKTYDYVKLLNLNTYQMILLFKVAFNLKISTCVSTLSITYTYLNVSFSVGTVDICLKISPTVLDPSS